MTAPDTLTTLFSPGRHLGKRFDAALSASTPHPGKYFTPRVVPVANLGDLHRILVELAEHGSGIIIRGALTAFAEAEVEAGRRIYRRKGARPDEPATFEDHVTGRRWLCLDLDDVPTPEGFDWSSLSAEALASAARAVVQRDLPDCFHDASFIVRPSSSAGVKEPHLFKAHLWFWLERPACSDSLKGYFKDQGSPVDLALFNAVQEHFVAPPRFATPDQDPIPPTLRTLLVEGGHEALVLPAQVLNRPDHEAAQAAGLVPRRAPTTYDHDPIEASDDEVTSVRRALAALPLDLCNEERMKVRNAAFTLAGAAVQADYEEWLRRCGKDKPTWHEAVPSTLPPQEMRRVLNLAAHPPRMRATFAQNKPDYKTQADARAHLPTRVRAALRRPGVDVLAVDPGIGKTHAALDAAFDLWLRGRAFIWAAPTHDVLTETHDEFMKRVRAHRSQHGLDSTPSDETIKRRVTRNKETCHRLEEVNAVRRVAPAAVMRICRGCEHYSKSDIFTQGEQCDYWKGAFDHAPLATFITHAYLLTNPDATPRRPAKLAKLKLTPTIAQLVVHRTPVRPRLTQRGASVHLSFIEDRSLGRVLPLTPKDLRTPATSGVFSPDPELFEDEAMARRLLTDHVYSFYGLDPHTPLEELLTHAGEDFSPSCAALIIDESPLKAIRQPMTLTPQDLERARLAGEVSVEDAALLGLVTLIREQRGGYAHDEALRASLPTLADARVTLDLDQRLERLDQGAKPEDFTDASALHALDQGLSQGLSGVYLQHGKLHVERTREVNWSNFPSVVVLDATARAELCAPLFGPDTRFMQARVAKPEHVTTHRINMNLGSRALLRGDRARPRLAWLAAHLGFDSDESLHVSFLRFLQEVDQLDHPTLEGPSIHFAGTEARGANVYKGCHTVIIDTYHPPKLAVHQLARFLERRGLDFETAHAEALLQLRGAEVLQALARIRPADATAENPKCIVMFDDNPQPLHHWLEPDEVVDPDELIFDSLGVVSTWTPEVLARIVEPCVSAASGVVPVAELERIVASVTQKTNRYSSSISHFVPCLSLAQAVENTAEITTRHVRRLAPQLAALLGLTLLELKTSRGGRGLQVLTPPDVTPVQLTDALRVHDPGLQWFEFNGARVHTEDQARELLAAAAKCDRDLTALASNDVARVVGEQLGKGQRTIQRRLARLDLTVEDLRNAWLDAQLPTPTHTLPPVICRPQLLPRVSWSYARWLYDSSSWVTRERWASVPLHPLEHGPPRAVSLAT